MVFTFRTHKPWNCLAANTTSFHWRIYLSKAKRKKKARLEMTLRIGEVSMTNRADAVSVKNGTSFNFHIFKVSNYLQKDFLLRFEHIEGLQIPQHDVSLLHVTSWCASLCMYGFDFSRAKFQILSSRAERWLCDNNLDRRHEGWPSGSK